VGSDDHAVSTLPHAPTRTWQKTTDLLNQRDLSRQLADHRPSLLLFILVGTVLLVDGSAYPDCGLPRRSPPVVEVLASEHA
jgi:hypothetical protein